MHIPQRAARLFPAILLALAPHSVWARSIPPAFELVHNAPEGTSLETPNLPDAQTVWINMIDNARHQVDIEQFYVVGKQGEALDRVIQALDAAGKRGVKIRFLMEKQGEKMSDAATIARLEKIPNLQFRVLAWADVNASAGAARTGIIHAKFMVVDGQLAYVGSQNFDWRSLSQIDETGVRIAQPRMAGQVQAIFDHDWQAQALLAAGKPVPVLRHDVYAPIDAKAFLAASPNAFDPAGVSFSQAALVKLLNAARHDIRIEVMDYSVTAFGGGAYHIIDDALRRAAARGVKVRLIVADWALTSQRLPGLENLASVPDVSIRVARIPQLDGDFIPYARVVHTKDMTIDGKIAWVGTSNWEGGYMDTSRNLEVVLRDPALAAQLQAMQDRLWNSDYTLPLAEAIRQPRAHPGEE